MSQATSATSHSHGNADEPEYRAYLERMQTRFSALHEGASLFRTSATGLWETYLASFHDPVERQYHNCNACRHFIERFGSLVVLDANGRPVSAAFGAEAPQDLQVGLSRVAALAVSAPIETLFLSSESVWGQPRTGIWTHLALRQHKSRLYRAGALTAEQAMAAKREDFKTIHRALAEFSHQNLSDALLLLRSDSLYRSEKVLGQVEWLYELKDKADMLRGQARDNAIWVAVATAPAGFCHPRSGMVGALLEDLAAGKPMAEVKRAFAAKMHPLAYQRPQAAPAAGTIQQAEALVERLGIARSLERRFARLDEVQALWRPQAAAPQASGSVFGHLQPARKQPSIELASVTQTWEKFCRETLPSATRIQLLVPHSGPFTSLLTATHADAPPIIQWDLEEARNPVSWYFRSGCSTAREFGLASNAYADVTAVALKPSMWGGAQDHFGRAVFFALQAAAESVLPGLCLFPEILKSDLHGVRSVVEAHSKSQQPTGQATQSAAGLMYEAGRPWDVSLRVTTPNSVQVVKLDRWD